MKELLLVGAMLLVVSATAQAQQQRSSSAVRQFEHANPPPGPRSDYVVDHIVPLRNGGTNDQSNLQWQTTGDAKAKDKIECDGHKCGR